MKPINFLNTIGSRQELIVQRWIYSSIGLVLITVCMLSYVQIKKTKEYHAICISCDCCEKTDVDHVQLQQQMEALQVQEKELQEKAVLLSNHKQSARVAIDRLKYLAKSCGSDCHLQAFSANGGSDLQLIVSAPNSERISRLLASLSASKAFDTLMLVSMQPKDSGYLFTIKGHC